MQSQLLDFIVTQIASYPLRKAAEEPLSWTPPAETPLHATKSISVVFLINMVAAVPTRHYVDAGWD